MSKPFVLLTDGLESRKAPVGFSWTTFFFGGWPAIFRGDYLQGFLILLACMFTYGLAGIVAAFFYNGMFIKRSLKTGYKVVSMHGITEEQLKHQLNLVSLPKANA